MKRKLAMDKSVRSTNDFGHLHVEVSNISKAVVNPYYGQEIPNFESLGLDPGRKYMLLRDPEELRKAADTFNNLPLLIKHVPVTAEAPSKDLWVGTTGSDAVFEEPYLRNSLAVWDATGVAAIESNKQKQLSSAYSYDVDMTPGTYGGVKYDGVMRNIKGNHVALVEEGRAGPDVVVGDSKLLEKPKMKLSAKALALSYALAGYASTVIAQDAQIGELSTVVGGVKSLNKKEQAQVVKKFTDLVTPHLAADADLEALPGLVAAMADPDDPTPEVKAPGAMDNGAELSALLQRMGVGPDIVAKIQSMCAGGAMDEDKDDDDKVSKPAMDAAIADAVKATEQRMQAIRAAEIEVQPLVGTLSVAMDSAEAVYKLALDHAKVPTEGVDPSAYKPMVAMLKANKATTAVNPARLGMDTAASGAAAFAELFPKANPVKGGV